MHGSLVSRYATRDAQQYVPSRQRGIRNAFGCHLSAYQITFISPSLPSL